MHASECPEAVRRRRNTTALSTFAGCLALTLIAANISAQESGSGEAPALSEQLLEPFKFRFIGPANPSGRVTAIAVPEADDHKTIYAGLASGGLWKTTNMGTTWKPIFDDEGSSTIGDVAVAEWDTKVVWVGTGERNSLRSNAWGDGVYRSTDGGSSWEHMGLKETREIGHQIASGMMAAHASGVVHGDLKPANLLLTPDGTVKVLDFGLAGRRHVSEDGQATLTLESDRRGIVAGTPSFMSPEQADGQPATTASDVFSFGLILYELLTGERRFADQNVLEVLKLIRSVDPSTYADRLEEPFSSLVGQMLVGDPQSRTIDMAAVAEALN